MNCLFAVSAVDQSIQTVEDNAIRQIASELRLEHADFIAARSRACGPSSRLEKDVDAKHSRFDRFDRFEGSTGAGSRVSSGSKVPAGQERTTNPSNLERAPRIENRPVTSNPRTVEPGIITIYFPLRR